MNFTTGFDKDDFNRYRFGGSIGQGDNGLGDDTLIAGLHFQYIWSEKGYDAGGKQFQWNTEVLYRDISMGEGGHDHDEEEHHEEEEEEHHEEEEHEEGESGSVSEWGFYSEVIYYPVSDLAAGFRVGYVEGIEELSLE